MGFKAESCGILWNPWRLDPPQSQKKSHDDVGIYVSILARVICRYVYTYLYNYIHIYMIYTYIYMCVHRIQYKISVLVNSCNLFSLTIAVMIHLHTHMHIYIVFVLDHVVPPGATPTIPTLRASVKGATCWMCSPGAGGLRHPRWSFWGIMRPGCRWLGEPWGNP